MNTELAPEALDFERSVRSALEGSGGFELVQLAEAEPAYRRTIGDQLGALGMWDIDVAADDVQLAAAALGCRAAGWFALPYPLAERLAARQLEGAEAVAVATGALPRFAHADLAIDWFVVGLDGRAAPVVRAHPAVGGKLGRFVSPVELGPWSASIDVVPMLLVLQCWTLLGMLQSAQELTCNHVRDRQQFGQALADFQSVQFALTDVSVATQGLEELCKYTLWALRYRTEDALTDALALRTAALEAAEIAFRTGHQLHGAIGFCDETPFSWLSRYSQTLRRLPFGRSDSESLLADRMNRFGFYTPVFERVGG